MWSAMQHAALLASFTAYGQLQFSQLCSMWSVCGVRSASSFCMLQPLHIVRFAVCGQLSTVAYGQLAVYGQLLRGPFGVKRALQLA